MSLAAIIMNLTPVTPIPPKPKPHFVPTVGQISTGGGWQHPSEEEADEGEWIQPEPAPKFGIIASSLSIIVRATILPVEVVERGNLIHFIAPFIGPPDEVHFSYVAPGSGRPVVDPGYGQPGSRIKRVNREELLALGYNAPAGWAYYVITIDSTGMPGGTLEGHFWGTGKFQASGFPEVKIPERKRQLL